MKRYVEDPVALLFNEDNYYLVTYNRKHEKSLHYRVDRMDTVEIEDEPICEAALIKKRKTENYTEQVFKMYSGETELVTLEFAPDKLGVIYDKFGEDIEVRHADKGWLKIKVTVQISPTFWGWIYQLGDKIKIVSPKGVKPPFDINSFYESAKEYDDV